MFIQLNKEKQKRLINSAIKKAGSYRKLAKILNIPRSSIVRYVSSETIPEERFNEIINLLGRKEEGLRLDNNWKQIKGGKRTIVVKKLKGTYQKDLENAQKKGAIKLKEWHKNMKKNNPREYHLVQYSKFKKIGGYKYKTNKGELVRNKFEKEIANILYKLKIEYQYEPLVNIEKRYFFPDFLINNKIIIEVTAWKGETKAYKLIDKIEYLKKRYKVYVVIPKNLYSYYKILNNHLILGLDEFVPVAQTFSR